MAFYESIFIVRPDLTTEQVDVVAERVEKIIQDTGGRILRVEKWGRRTLAYPVKKNGNGYYIYKVIEGAGPLISTLEARLVIDEDILKFMNVRVDMPDMNPTPLAPPDDRRESRGEDSEEAEAETNAEAGAAETSEAADKKDSE
ncbi:MAG: 30S ribosomal protein S6 [Magnetococcales bacterium]|nr:30S ribosomal protein S6 [Magnetococcales bacterium]